MVASVSPLCSLAQPCTLRHLEQYLRGLGYEVVAVGRRPVLICEHMAWLEHCARMRLPQHRRWVEARYEWVVDGMTEGRIVLTACLHERGGRLVPVVDAGWSFFTRHEALLVFKSIPPYFVVDEDDIEITADGIARLRQVAV